MSTSCVRVHVDEVVRETATAFLLLIAGEHVWMPRSQIVCSLSCPQGIDLEITAKMARQKGLEPSC